MRVSSGELRLREDELSARDLRVHASSVEVEGLQSQLKRAVEDAETTERRLMAQLSERSAALNVAADELQAERERVGTLEAAGREQHEAASALARRLQQAHSDGALALANVERLESELRQKDEEVPAPRSDH